MPAYGMEWDTLQDTLVQDWDVEPAWHKTAKPVAAAASTKSVAAAGWGAKRSGVGRVPTPSEKKAAVGGFVKVISKKNKKKQRGAGLMKIVSDSPVEAVAANDDDDDEMVSDSPYIVDSKNPFALLDNSAEEEAVEAEAEKAKKAPKAKIVATKGATPVARRTRGGGLMGKVSQVMMDVVAAVSPMIEKSLSKINPANLMGGVFDKVEDEATAAPAPITVALTAAAPKAAAPKAKAAATKPAATKRAPKAPAAAKLAPAVEAPVRRSTRLRSAA